MYINFVHIFSQIKKNTERTEQENNMHSIWRCRKLALIMWHVIAKPIFIRKRKRFRPQKPLFPERLVHKYWYTFHLPDKIYKNSHHNSL